MKILVFLTIVFLSCIGIANADLDNHEILNYVVAVYHFESTERTESGQYTVDSGPRGDHSTLFVAGEVAVKQRTLKQPSFFVGPTTLLIIGTFAEEQIRGSIRVDDVGFFDTGFSAYEVKGLYNDGLSKFLEMMPVNPQGRLTTTWGEIKSRR